ncbi:hypothetical protein DL93DRAFT_1857572 [Clavulina sp. PMI_390]|nr:hypothetical protein DL93DRAFT_1857572 [Clavulina sp. PMI_390]
MSKTTLAKDAEIEGVSDIMSSLRSLSLGSQDSTLLRGLGENIVPNPLESVASDMLTIISDLRDALPSVKCELDTTNSSIIGGSDCDKYFGNQISGPSGGVQRFWPFKGPLPFVRPTAVSPTSGPGAEHLIEAWAWLLDACTDSVGRAVAAYVLLESEANHYRPPLFWLLFSGHR